MTVKLEILISVCGFPVYWYLKFLVAILFMSDAGIKHRKAVALFSLDGDFACWMLGVQMSGEVIDLISVDYCQSFVNVSSSEVRWVGEGG